jgi:hypothetical protein
MDKWRHYQGLWIVFLMGFYLGLLIATHTGYNANWGWWLVISLVGVCASDLIRFFGLRIEKRRKAPIGTEQS